MKLVRSICAWGLIGFLMQFGGLVFADTPRAGEIQRTIRYGIIVENTMNQPATNARLFVYAPVTDSPRQICTGITANYPYEIIKTPGGNQTLLFQLDALPAFGHRQVNITAVVTLCHPPGKSDHFDTGTMPIFLQHEPFIEKDDLQIQQLALALKANDRPATALKIHNWISHHITYSGYSPRLRGARYALNRKHGDCTEMSTLFVALCRANQIPARLMGGYLLKRDGVLRSKAYHNWAEFHDGTRWQIADPQQKHFQGNESSYIAMNLFTNLSDSAQKGFYRCKIEGKGLAVRHL